MLPPPPVILVSQTEQQQQNVRPQVSQFDIVQQCAKLKHVTKLQPADGKVRLLCVYASGSLAPSMCFASMWLCGEVQGASEGSRLKGGLFFKP